MSDIQRVIKLIGNAAREVGEINFEAALGSLNEELDKIPEKLHLWALEQMWGENNA